MIRVLNKDYRAKLYNDLINLAFSTQSRQIDSSSVCSVCVCVCVSLSLSLYIYIYIYIITIFINYRNSEQLSRINKQDSKAVIAAFNDLIEILSL